MENIWKDVVQPMIDTKTPWAFTMGNHDSEADLTDRELADLDSTYPLSLTSNGPLHVKGSTNYVLSIFSNSSDVPSFNLWFLDSGKEDCIGWQGKNFSQRFFCSIDEINRALGWGCIESSQIDWYEKKSQQFTKMNDNEVIPAMAFFHIPLPEYMDLWNTEETEGNMNEGMICCSSQNTGFFSSIKKMGDINSIYCGHDHKNDYQGNYFFKLKK